MLEFSVNIECKGLRVEENALLRGLLVDEELLGVILDEDLKGSSTGKVAEDDLLTTLKKRVGVEAQLLDLTEYGDIVHAEPKMEPASPAGHRVLRVKTNNI